jgi:RsiW-degrading membrane proteinase PrsW (M82 family)
MEFIFVLALSLAPGLVIALFIYLRDIHQPEPVSMLVKSFALGVVSFFLSLAIGYGLKEVTHLDYSNLIDQLIRAFIFVALLEEACKYLFLRGIIFRSKYFDEPFDGIVYAVMIGMGFATAENVIYAIQGGGSTALVRMFTAVPAHAVFAVIMGFFLGEAKAFPTSASLFGFLAIFFATFIHGFYDYFLFISFIPGLWVQAIVSLIIAIGFTYFAIKKHQRESPHRGDDDDD